MRRLRKSPQFVAVAACGLFAVFGGTLAGESIGSWYAGLEKPWFLVPLRVFYLVGVLYYILFAVVLYRVLVHVENHRGRMRCLALVISVMLLNELWNYGFFGLRSTLAGFLGIVVFLVPLTTLIVCALQVRATLGAGAGTLLLVGPLRSGVDVRAMEAKRRHLICGPASLLLPLHTC